jgi:hypothetical protein
VKVPGALRAPLASRLDQALAGEVVAAQLALLGGGGQGIVRLEEDAAAVVIREVRADAGQVGRADAAAQQDGGGAVGARRQHDQPGGDARVAIVLAHDDCLGVAGAGLDAARRRAGADGQVVAVTGRVHVGEGRVPADGSERVDPNGRDALDGVGVVEVAQLREAQLAGRLDHGSMPRPDLLVRARPHSQLGLGAPQVRPKRPEAEGLAPLVVVAGRAPDREAGIVGGAAAEDPGPQGGPTAAERPVVRVRDGPRVEHLGGPAAPVIGAVVRAGLDQADGAVRILAQARGQDAAGGPASNDEHVEALLGGHGEPILGDNDRMPGRDRKQLAREAFRAFAAADRDTIEELLSTDFSFFSPPDPGLDRAGFFERCWPNAGYVDAFAFERLVESGDEVIVTYEATRTDGSRFRNTEVLTFGDDDRIRRQEVYFGWDL